MRRLFVLGVVLVAIVVAGAFVGFVVLDRGGAPTAARVKAFDSVAVRRDGAAAGRKLDAAIASIEAGPGHVRATSDVDACYADQQQEGFSTGYFNKTCFRRKVLLLDWPTAPSQTYETLLPRLRSAWLIAPNRASGVCFSQGVAITKDRDPRGVTLDFIVRPADPRRLDRSLACLQPIDQVAGVLTLRSPATPRDLVFDRRRVFDDVDQEEAIVRETYPTIVRLGFTVQYYSRRIG